MGLLRPILPFIAVGCVLLLAGCLESFNGSASVSYNAGAFNVSYNGSANGGNFSLPNSSAIQSGLYAAIPDNASVCFYGQEDERFSGNFFGNVSVLGKPIALYSRWVNSSKSENFTGCASIILLDDGVGDYLERNQRQQVDSLVSQGVGLIVSGEGGAHSASDASIYGWDPGMGADVPAVITVPSHEPMGLGTTVFSGVFIPTATDTALSGVSEFTFNSMSFTISQPANNGQVIALAAHSDSPTSTSYPAIIRSANALTNENYYFAFNAYAQPQILYSAVRGQAQQYFNLFFLRIA